ncbi:MAG: glutamate synthase subunit beta [Desulfobacteraceae bacterium]|jgi:glutamate synthase (NADPH/NADH) small chain|uniref:Glutamate synthase subunit beta n=1 Tax=Candidatus Desulfacyla euxinica TaxID=2841693 RepID=A0A8J6MVY1_9DELT|nr:glutamate synthase subunit beta [Candidatus Desulfacyla euxinica]MBL6979092.1 glutamate synthase subunit beta [Desulfobacteraceae bacterium]
MGDPRGFIEIKRKDAPYRSRDERLRDYKAVEHQLSYSDLNKQAARCMDCGTPFCHAYGCPISNLVPEFNDFAFRGNWQQALEILVSANNFPEFTGRVCPAPCEAACVSALNSDPVTIRQIELAIIEKGFESGLISSEPPSIRLDKKVAVIGSGPAGLTIADSLNRAGYRVTVFENANYPGGILTYGIPDFKLEKWVVERRIKLMAAQGITFETGVKIGDDISCHYLKKRFDAICLACGARKPRDLPVPGRDLNGIYFAMDYLSQQNKRNRDEYVGPSDEIIARDKKVVVIGGGDTGSDCLGTALRQGAIRVSQLEIVPKPPVKRSDNTPWPMWPVLLRQTHAHKEGGDLFWSIMTKEFLGEKGVVKKIRCAEVEWVVSDVNRPPVPIEKASTEFEIEADLVILAMGFLGPEESNLVAELSVELDGRGNVKADDHGMTNLDGIFVAGDMAMGQSLVVRAIADGRKTALGIKTYLR